MASTNRPIKRALVSVFHKEGIDVLAQAFIAAGTEVVSTGSTAKRLAELGVNVTEVSEVTGFPESLAPCGQAPRLLQEGGGNPANCVSRAPHAAHHRPKSGDLRKNPFLSTLFVIEYWVDMSARARAA